MHRASAVRPALLMATATAALLVARVHSSTTYTSTSSTTSSTSTHHHHHHDQPKSPLETVNPWLYACDLVQPATNDDLKGACSTIDRSSNMVTMMMLTSMGGPGPPNDAACPPQCTTSSSSSTTHTNSNNNNTTNNTTINQCLEYLEESHKVAVCDGDGDRARRLQDVRLRHCCEHAVITSLRPLHREAVLAGGANCKHHLDALLEIDALAARISCEFTEVLTRYDCGQPYSIVYQCADCKEAYRRWVCSSLVPHLTETGGRVRPCRSVCQTVEQRCPYMLPGDRAPAHPTQYAGEPTFLCLDPNIPEVVPQKKNSSHGDDDCCYTYCGTPGRPCAHCPRGASGETWQLPPCITPPNISANSTSDGNSSTGGQCLSQCRPSMTSAASPSVGRGGLAAASPAAVADCRHHWTLYNVVMCRHWTVGSSASWWWTIWTLVVILEQQRQLACLLGTLLTDLIHCSLLMCVQCARTPLALLKTKWKSRRSTTSSS